MSDLLKTERLFDNDPYRIEFEARVVATRAFANQHGVVLDRTLFYPTSGGQPADRGCLGGVDVVDVVEEGGAIVHVLEEKLGRGQRVRGEIDWDRRFDHMQQHTGQHTLSQAFLRVADARTVGFHLGTERSTIDLDKVEFSSDVMRSVERTANGVVFENREILVRYVSPDEIVAIPLRKEPEVEGTVRVVEVEGFDWSCCCGTHVRRTGELGLIKVIRWERYKGGTRVAFLCGERALRDYQQKTETLGGMCRTLTAGEEEVVGILGRWQEEKKAAAKRIRSLLDDVLENEAEKLVEKAEPVGSYRVVSVLFENRDTEEVQNLVKKLCRIEGIVALVGVKGKRGQLYFGRFPSVELDVGSLMQEACREVGGKGGGSPSMAQGGIQDASNVEAVLQRARTFLEAN